MRHTIVAALLTGALLIAGPAERAAAWGTQAQLALVSTALNVFANEANIPLGQLRRELLEGVNVSRGQLFERLGDQSGDPLRAIETEVFVLQAVRPQRIDPYYAYRIGMLGKLVAEVTAPMATADPSFRDAYYADVEDAIDNLSLSSAALQQVEPQPYLRQIATLQNGRNDVIVSEYRSGIGFDGSAKLSLAEDASRSVRAIMNIWFTAMGGNEKAAVSEDLMRRYALDAVQFYVARGNAAEIDAAAKRLQESIPMSPDLKIAIADAYFDAEFNERAVALYQEVAEEAPGRRDVIERIARYFMRQGEGLLAEEELEEAEEAFAAALDADPLHPTAEARRLEVEAMIAAREMRLAETRTIVERAENLRGLAQEEALRGRVAEAIALLREAVGSLGEVGEEFPAEAQRAQTLAAQMNTRVAALREELLASAQRYSGTSVDYELKRIAADSTDALVSATLQSLLMQERAQRMEALSVQVEPLATP